MKGHKRGLASTCKVSPHPGAQGLATPIAAGMHPQSTVWALAGLGVCPGHMVLWARPGAMTVQFGADARQLQWLRMGK